MTSVTDKKGEKKIKVLYIAGWGRSGTTILDNILGQYEGFFSVGELRYIWDRGFIENRVCGCGENFRSCAVWKQIIENSYGSMDGIDAKMMVSYRESVHSRDTLLSKFSFGKKVLFRRLGQYLQYLEKLYHSIQSVTGCKVIVDSSKFPSHLYALHLIPSIDLHVIHMIRDPRAVAFSWQRKKIYDVLNGEVQYIKNPGIIRSSWLWSTWNYAIEMLWKNNTASYLQLLYEEFIVNPRHSVEMILNILEEASVPSPFLDDHRVKLEVCHSVSGNPSRFVRGIVELRKDEEWRSNISISDKFLVELLTFPFLLKYRYIFGRRSL